MERRDAVKYISLLLGGSFIGADALITGCKSKTGSHTDWTEDDIAYLDEIAETILPRTSTPGAKDARVGQFMTVMVNDCYEASDQKVFRDGMSKLNEVSNKKFDGDFMKLNPQQRKQLLTELDTEAKASQLKVKQFNDQEEKKRQDEAHKGNLRYIKQHMSPHYFTMMKQLTLLGFFTSKEGMQQAVRYMPVPGRYEGCVPYKKGDKLIV